MLYEVITNNLVPNTVDELDGRKITQKRYIKGNRVIKEIIINKDGEENK